MITSKTLFGIISAGVMLFSENMVYGRINKSKISINKLLYLFMFIIISSLVYFNNVYNVNGGTFIIQLFLMTLFNKCSYKEETITSLIKTCLIFILIALFEIILTIIIMAKGYDSIIDFNNNYLFKTLFSLLVMLCVYLLIIIKKVNRLFNSIVDYVNSKSDKINFVILGILILVIGVVGYKLVLNYKSYGSNLILIICFCIIIGMLAYEIIKRSEEIQKHNALLENMSKYEELIDSQRIARHELLNHLLVLKSFKNKNSKDFEKSLEELISENENSEFSGLTTVYNLPSGLKGIIYYKVYKMKTSGIDVFVNVDRNTISTFDELDSKYYVETCRMVGILLDNAFDASSKAKKKSVVIDIYKDSENLIIYIENTYKGNIEMDKINEKGYSSKGKNRGIGLHVVNSMIKKRNCYTLSQEISASKTFVTKLCINKEKTSKK